MHKPLSEQLRPEVFDDIIGQDHLLGPQGFITKVIAQKRPLSILLWGPPGTGKTSIARLYAKAFALRFEAMNAIFSGVADIKKIVSAEYPLFQETILLFVDEIHRFNKAQQDAFLPYLENGRLILVGATVENPSFYLNKALLSRMRVLKVNALNPKDLEKILHRYEAKKGSLAHLDHEARKYLLQISHGDGRYLLNLIENIEGYQGQLTLIELQNFLQERAPLFDKKDDMHYDLISALHKSVRGSDPQAALYWFSRMILGGEDPLFIARRLIRMASEDIGLADPQALVQAISARDAYEMLGSPEGELALAQAVVYLALAPKSNAVYQACTAALAHAKETSHLPPPPIIASFTSKDYIYDHDTPLGFSGQDYFPPGVCQKEFYEPVNRGFERQMGERLAYFKKLKK